MKIISDLYILVISFVFIIKIVNATNGAEKDSVKWGSSFYSNNYGYDNPEECNGKNMEWLTDGPACDVYCDQQPLLPKPQKIKDNLRLSNKVKPCQGRLEDFIQHEINENEETENEKFIDLTKIAKKVTDSMRVPVSGKHSVSKPVKYEGCYCEDGYARYGLNCVSLTDCPNQLYENPNNCNADWNEHWEDSGPQCDIYCPVQPRGYRSNWNRNKCTGNVVNTLKLFEPDADSLESETGIVAFEKYAVNVTKELRHSFSSNYDTSVAYSGCYCDLGYARYGDLCVEVRQCPKRSTTVPFSGNSNLCQGLNEEFRYKSDGCEVYCDIQPLKYGRWSSLTNSCGKIADVLHEFIPTAKEFKDVTTQNELIVKYALNITEELKNSYTNKNQGDDGCYCKKGYARYGYRCLKIAECPSRKCHKDEIYLTCGPYCENTCSNLFIQRNTMLSECSACSDVCISGCYCPTNLVRDDKGRCIEPQHCWNYNRNVPIKD